MGRPFRLGYLVSHPIQYQVPLLRRIAAHPDVDLKVFFLSDFSVHGYRDEGFGVTVRWDVPLLAGYPYTVLPALGARDRVSFWRPFVYALSQQLREGHFDALWLHGYLHQASLRALAIAKRSRTKVLLRTESHLLSHQRSQMKLTVMRAMLPHLFRAIDGFLAIGTLNKEYYLAYGAAAESIFMMPYAVDNDYFRQAAESARPQRSTLKAELGLRSDRPVILYASKLQARKRPGDLLDAYMKLSPNGADEPQPYLVFVGDGEERDRLEARVRSLGWSSVRFLGFRNQTEMPRFYDLCDVFVLPSSHEPWGLVVNEVMNASKPVIVSDRVGATPDLVRSGVNGFVFPAGDTSALASHLRELTSNPARAVHMGAESLRRISTWSFDADIEGLLGALRAVSSDTNTSTPGPKRLRAFYNVPDEQRYGRAALHEHSQALQQLVSTLALRSDPVVDLGCGKGPFRGLTQGYVGIDVSHYALRTGAVDHRCIQADVQALPLQKDSVAMVISTACLEHLPTPEACLAEIDRTLRPGGIAYLAPAWFCRRWAARALPSRAYRELGWRDRFLKALIPLLESRIIRVLGIAPARVWREARFAATRRPQPFSYRRLSPNLDTYLDADSDASASMDPHAAILYFRSRGYDILSAAGWRRLIVRHAPVVVRKPLTARAERTGP